MLEKSLSGKIYEIIFVIMAIITGNICTNLLFAFWQPYFKV